MFNANDFTSAVFIDGPFLIAAAQTLGFKTDFIALKGIFQQNFTIKNFNYFAAEIENTSGHSPMRGLLDFLEYNQYRVIKRTIVKETDDELIPYNRKSMEIEMATEMMLAASMGSIEQAIVFSGSGNLAYTLNRMRERGCRIVVVAPTKRAHESIRRIADDFVELTDLAPKIAKHSDIHDTVAA